jgi:hypothetical protein
MLSIFWRSSRIFIILLKRWNLCAEIALTSAMHFLYFFHRCFHWLLWYNVIAMLSLIEIIIKKLNHLHLDCILTSSWINVFRSTIFLMTEKRKVRWLIFISWTRMSLHAHLVSCVLSLTRLRNVTLFCSMFRWTCNELVYISISTPAICKEWQRQILMLLVINISNIHLISCLRFTSLLADAYS